MNLTLVPICGRGEFESWLQEQRTTAGQTSTLEPGDSAIAYDVEDLYFLYCMVRQTAAVSVLEYGSGWSTLALGRAILENRDSFGRDFQVAHPNPFELLSVDASEYWQMVATERLPKKQLELTTMFHAQAQLVNYQGQVASVFEGVPAFTPDLVYLDAPDPEQVVGSVFGRGAELLNQIPNSADVLLREHSLWPESLVVTDGRTANARFLQSNLRRNWQWLHDPYGDRTVFRLEEPSLGWKSLSHTHFRSSVARELRAMS